MKWRFKTDAEPQGAGDFWYDLYHGGYIKPYEVLADKKQIAKLKAAIAIVGSFEDALDNAGLIFEL